MKISILKIHFICIALSVAASTAIAGDIATGESLAQTCMGCHGAPGLRNPSPVFKIPMIGGQPESYLTNALADYKNEKRSHATMRAQAASLSESDIANIAAYFASLQGEANQDGSNTSAENAPDVIATCVTCHGVNGNEQVADAPLIGGQYESYLIQALKEYRAGTRQNPIMAGFTRTLTLDQIKQIADWYSHQPNKLQAPRIGVFK